MMMYPNPTSGNSIRHAKLSPLSSNEGNVSKSYFLFSDESNKATICRGTNSSAAAPSLSLPVASTVSLSASPRATAWCPFVTSTVAETGDDVLGLITSSIGCPLQLRYFSDPLLPASDGGVVRNDDIAHDPNWVEASYKFHDNMEYPLCANSIEWSRSRANHIVAGYDKGHVVVFDAERPGRETVWRFQVNSVHACRHKNGAGPQHAISAVSVHDTQSHLLAVGTRGTGEIPILDTRMRQPAMVMRGGHGSCAAVTQARFDPLCATTLFSASRGNAFTASATQENVWLPGVVQHDMRMPLAPCGVLRRPPCSASMQPLDFDLISPTDAESIRVALEGAPDSAVAQSQQRLSQSQQQQQQPVVAESLNQGASVVVSGSGLSTIFVGQCTSLPAAASSGNRKNPSNDEDEADWTHITSYSQGHDMQQPSGERQAPVTTVAVCARRGILCCAGGERRFTERDRRNLLFADSDDDDNNGPQEEETQQQRRRQRSGQSNSDEDENGRKRLPTLQNVKASKPCPSSVLCRVYKF